MVQIHHSNYLTNPHFGSLDGLRFICITAVIWHHSPIWQTLPETFRLASRGFVGVDFFFILSGFLITTLLLREESAVGRVNLWDFYWRRALRILPIYYLVVTLAGMYEISVKGDDAAREILPFYYLFLANFLIGDITFLTPTWSLSVEEQYYLIWPALLLLLPRAWLIPTVLGLIAVNVASATGFFTSIGINAIEFKNLRLAIEGATYAPILMGSLVALLLHNPICFKWVARPFRQFFAPWVCFFLLLISLDLIRGKLEGFPNLAVHTLMCFCLISLVVREDNGLSGVLKVPLFARIGKVSYGIYLYHLFALAIATEWLGVETSWGIFWVTYAFSFLIAEVSFRTFESRFLRFRRKPLEEVGTISN